ncbi:MAG: transcriptional regulator with XRE-family HTH domain [Pseudoalteromonas tetraodonis]
MRERRRHLEISQVDFAKLAGVAVHTVSDIESGKGNPTLDVLLKVLDPLGLKLSVKPRAILPVSDARSHHS